MERHLVSIVGPAVNRSLVEAEVQEAVHASKKRKGDYTVEQVRLVTDDARQYGATKAGKKHPNVKVSTIETWLAYWRKNAKYYEPGAKKRGRPSFLSPSQKDDVLQSLDALGQAPNGKSISSRTVAAIARGVVSRQAPQRLLKHGGGWVMDRYWGTKFLQRNGRTPRATTTTRMVPTADIVATSATFFPHLLEIQAKYQFQPSLTFNADEFFMLLMQNRKWTWAKKGAQTVPLRECRLGFTGLLVICADGSLVEVGMYWPGTSGRTHAQCDAVDNLVRDPSGTDSHFMNAQTWARFIRRFLIYVSSKRVSLGMPDTYALLQVNGASQHVMDDDLKAEVLNARVIVDSLPPKQTHVWQAADQQAIAVFRRKVDTLWDDGMERLWAEQSSDDAVAAACAMSAPLLRRRMHFLFASALGQLSEKSILNSWDMTCVPWVLWHSPPRVPTSFHMLCEKDSVCSRSFLGMEIRQEERRDARDVMARALQARQAVDEDDDSLNVPPILGCA